MKITLRPRSLSYIFSALLIATLSIVASAAEKNDVPLATVESELQRAHAELGKLDPAPYFISYTIRDQSSVAVIASQGGLITSAQVQT